MIFFYFLRYDHEKDDEYERMQKAEDFLLKKHEEFLFPQVLHTV
jgi:ssRNA-specific RNase YbeY (16S rRNA maturation enzyme)